MTSVPASDHPPYGLSACRIGARHGVRAIVGAAKEWVLEHIDAKERAA
jgi:hypothetical protein